MTFDQKSEPFEGMDKAGFRKQGSDKFKSAVFETSKNPELRAKY